VIEEVFHEMGLGSVTSLHDFYHSRIIKHQKNIEKTCQQLMAEYEKLKQPTMIKTMETVPVIRCSNNHF